MVNKWSIKGIRAGLILPNVCFLCGSDTGSNRLLCGPCLGDLGTMDQACCCCGRPMATPGLCPGCSARKPLYEYTIVPYHYDYPVSFLIKLLKYKNNYELARELGIALAEHVRAVGRRLPEVILPVPLHPLRSLVRGYNQAREIADGVAVELKLPVDTTLIRRTRHTRPQFNLDQAARRRNIKGAFRLTRTPEYHSIALLDDVVTTGTTVNEIAALLKQAGMKTIEVWACARAG